MLSLLLRGLVDLMRLPLLPLWWLWRQLGRPRARWIEVRLRRRLVELSDTRAWWQRWLPALAAARPTALEDLRRLAEHAAADRRVDGVLFVVPQLLAGWATARSLREVLLRLRAAGTGVAVFLPDGATHKELYVASAADTVLMPPQATVSMLGLAAQSRYLKGALDRLGLEVDRFARAEFKTAGENLTREEMSEAQRAQLDALLESLDRELRGALQEGRGLSGEAVAQLFESGLLRGEEAVEAGAVDALVYEDELPATLAPDVAKPRLGRAPAYLAWHEGRWLLPLRPRPHIAVVPVHGPIAPGRRADRVVAALRLARRSKRVRGVILHVNSPGGSAAVSDRLHREVVRVAEKKPIVACFGDVAASGGYYVAAGAAAIVAQPTTITGSIGVVSIRPTAQRLLERVGVRTEVVRKAPHADMFSPSRPLTDDERALLEREMDLFYRDFVALVARGRGRPFESIEPLARGRIWSGADALERGLVDRLGGLEVALEEVRARAPEAGTLRPRLLVPRTTDVPPEPPSAAAALLDALVPDGAALAELLQGPERVVLWEPAIPELS